MARGRRKTRGLDINKAKEFLNYLSNDKPLFPWMIVLILVGWAIERWVICFTNFLPIAIAVWATYQYGNHQAQIQAQVLERKWKQTKLHESSVTPLEHCEWLNKLLNEVWLNFINPKLSLRFSSMVEKRLKHRKPPLIEKIELQEFSLGSCPPSLGFHGTRWLISGDQRILQMGFDWDSTDMSILLAAKLAKPLMGMAKIVVNSIHIKGELVLRPILDGKGVLYSFLSAPDVRINVAFGGGGSQSLPATELPGVSSWLVKLLNDTLEKTMVEPRRRCFSLPPVDLRKKAAGGILYVKVISASKVSNSNMKTSPSRRQQSLVSNGSNSSFEGYYRVEKELCTFVEVELEQLSRKTDVRSGSSPKWDSTFNMVLHDETGILKFHLYESPPGSVKYNHLTTCEIKMKHVADDSVMYWALGPDNGVVARHAEFCGKEIEMVVPFEGVDSGELTVRLILKEWHFSDGSHSLSSFHPGSTHSLSGTSSSFTSNTGRKISVTVVEAKGLIGTDPYVKLQYGKAFQRTKTLKHNSNPAWDKHFEFDELENGECLKVKCYSEDRFGDENLGSARVSLEGLVEGSVRDVWIPLEKVDSGELRLKLEASKNLLSRLGDEGSSSKGSSDGHGWIELVLIEAKDLIAADLRGTSDPYVRIHYGKRKQKTKVRYKTLEPKWNEEFKFPDDGSSNLVLYVKDHNALLPTSSIGECIVNCQQLPVNQPYDNWIHLSGVKTGEIHIRITRKNLQLEKRLTLDSEPSSSKAHKISDQMKQIMIKLQTLVEDDNLDEVSTSLSELESLYDMQEEYMVQLETEQKLLLNKISELGQEIFNSTDSTLSKKSSIG